ncbi:MAG: hypothetical protein K0Q79_3308 [Flavipsychrobacter sp.]|jgi:photosystem II stability/assembly factor-like uncharacterized protein|nr:hypothetical protein [Flavipsychrobacter sp.]
MNLSKQLLCIAMLVVAGINNFALGQSTIDDDESKTVITSMAVCGDNIFAGTKKGIYRSADSGKVWRLVNGLPAPAWTIKLVSVGKNIFAVGFFPDLLLFISTDNGDSWKWVTVAADRERVMDVCVFKGRLFAATDKGLYVSTDEGAHWAADPGLKEKFASTAIAVKSCVLVLAKAESGQEIFYSSADGVKWDIVKSEGVRPNDVNASGDNIVATFCQYQHSMGDRSTRRGYVLWILSKNARKWEQAEFRARYFALDGDNIYAIKVQVTNEKKKDPGYVREIVKSDDKGRSWKTIDEKTDPFVTTDYGMQEMLHELDFWKSFEIEEIVAFRRGQQLAAEQREKEWQAELKRRREAPVYEDRTFRQGTHKASAQPDYRALSQDRFNAMHNTNSYIDSKGGMHIR